MKGNRCAKWPQTEHAPKRPTPGERVKSEAGATEEVNPLVSEQLCRALLVSTVGGWGAPLAEAGGQECVHTPWKAGDGRTQRTRAKQCRFVYTTEFIMNEREQHSLKNTTLETEVTANWMLTGKTCSSLDWYQ